MYNICVFGGTTEGRELVEFLSAQPCNVTACVVTDYAQSLLPASGHVTVSAKKLPAGEIAAMLLSQRFDLVVDATHPYAQSITKSIARACEILLRVLPENRLCGIVRNIGREGQSHRVLTLQELQTAPVDMFCTVFIGNSSTKELSGALLTPRGYRNV